MSSSRVGSGTAASANSSSQRHQGRTVSALRCVTVSSPRCSHNPACPAAPSPTARQRNTNIWEWMSKPGDCRNLSDAPIYLNESSLGIRIGQKGRHTSIRLMPTSINQKRRSILLIQSSVPQTHCKGSKKIPLIFSDISHQPPLPLYCHTQSAWRTRNGFNCGTLTYNVQIRHQVRSAHCVAPVL